MNHEDMKLHLPPISSKCLHLESCTKLESRLAALTLTALAVLAVGGALMSNYPLGGGIVLNVGAGLLLINAGVIVYECCVRLRLYRQLRKNMTSPVSSFTASQRNVYANPTATQILQDLLPPMSDGYEEVEGGKRSFNHPHSDILAQERRHLGNLTPVINAIKRLLGEEAPSNGHQDHWELPRGQLARLFQVNVDIYQGTCIDQWEISKDRTGRFTVRITFGNTQTKRET